MVLRKSIVFSACKDKQMDNGFAKQIFFDLTCEFVIQFSMDIGARMDWNFEGVVLG